MSTYPHTLDISQLSADQKFEVAAKHLYASVNRNGLLTILKRLFDKNNTSHLYTLDKVVGRVSNQKQKRLGVKTVNINQILGTTAKGRSLDFDGDFRPLQQHNKERWLRVAAAWMSGRRLGPVKLLQVGDLFFVEDGHHRISVARAMGEEQIEAEVVLSSGSVTLSRSTLAERTKASGNPVLQPAAT